MGAPTMFGSNAHYGHRSILNRYGGVPVGHPIPGLVQHGWNYDLGATLEDISLPHPEPFFLWSSRNLRQCTKAGIASRVRPIGAPFLYLPPDPELPTAPPKSLLVMPIHGWEKERIAQDFAEYAKQTATLAREFSKVTVCLYWFEYQFAAYRKPFEAEGFEVVTAGKRDRNPRFLVDLRRILAAHEYVTSNRAQTSVFYALALGRKAFLYGPSIGLDGRFDHSGQLYEAWQEREYPSLLWRQFQGDTNVGLGQDELGQEHVRSPEVLRELFLWDEAHRGVLDGKVAARRKQTKWAPWNRRAEEIRAGVERLLPPSLRRRREVST